MRDLKFRAWDHVDSVMLFADLGELQDLNGEWTAWDLPIDSPTNTGTPFDVMQFTGLNDKNGVDIYEGVIVDDAFDCGQLKIISWDNEKACFIDTTIMKPPIYKNMKPHSCPLSISTSTITNGKIIGNIYENAELLNDQTN